MDKKILYITSFVKEMYDLTGKRMIDSFYNTKQVDDLLVCYEDFEFNYDKDTILTYNLTDDEYLNNWLLNNKDIIPKQFGGDAPLSKFGRTDWNRKASRWFRKIASIKYALDTYGDEYDYLIWTDCDCIFKSSIPSSLHDNVLKDHGMFYYFGSRRRKSNSGYETGFLGFNKEKNGYQFIKMIIDAYEKDFRNFSRWDDGFVIRKVNELYNKEEKVKTRDIASGVSDPINSKNPYLKYLAHKKGTHHKSGIFKAKK